MMILRRPGASAATATLRCRLPTTTIITTNTITRRSRCCVQKTPPIARSFQAFASPSPSSFAFASSPFDSPLFSSSSLSPPFCTPSRRCLSSSSAATDALLDLLTREHAEEVQNIATDDVSSELQELRDDLVKTQGWKIVADRAMTRLLKTVSTATNSNNKLKIQVSFHCQDMVQVQAADAADYVEEQESEPVPEEEEEEAASPVRFTVTVSNPSASGSVGSMVLTCLSENATLQIESVTMTAVDTAGGGDAAASADNDEMYQGPEFGELAQDLQDAFYNFCQETCGINADVLAFVAMQADFQEQQCYVQFLHDASALVK